jgi:hypothetical protein
MNNRLEELKAELARRLGPVLPDVPAQLFEDLIELTALLQWERESKHRGNGKNPDPPSFNGLSPGTLTETS